MAAQPRNLQDLKDLRLTSWCQIPQEIFRSLVEFMPWLAQFLAAYGRPTAHYAGGHDVFAHLKLIYSSQVHT